MGQAVHVGGRGVCELSVPSAEYCCEPKIALKNKDYKNSKKKREERENGKNDSFK